MKARKNFFRRYECIVVIFAFILFSPLASIAQSSVKGLVVNQNGQPIENATVHLKGTVKTEKTDAEGNFTISVQSLNDVLIISSVGFREMEYNLNGAAVAKIVMTSDEKVMSEVVVTGYTVQNKKDITGSVAVVDVNELKKMPTGSAMQAMQGMAAGVNVITTGVPGDQSKIFIRGISSFGSTQPLVLIDGVQGDLNNLNAGDIESMQVLKDAGSASIYGVRGANGVVVVTTKKGRSGEPVISYDGYYGVTVPFSGNVLNTLNSPDFARLTKIYNPATVLFSNGLPDYTYGSSVGTGTGMEGDPAVDPSKYNLDPSNSLNNYLIQKINKTGTDWYHAMFKRAPATSHNITLSGGSNKADYLLSLGYLDQQGSIANTYLKRYSIRVNTSYKIKRFLKVGENLNAFYRKSPGFDNQGQFSPIANLYKMMPTTPVYDIMGNFGGTFDGPELGSDANPVATQERLNNNRSSQWAINGNVFAELYFLKHFTARTSFGGAFVNAYSQSFSYTGYNDKQGYNMPNAYSEGAGYTGSTTFTNTLVYNNSFNKHYLNILVGSEALKNYGRSVSGGSENFFSTNYDYLILGNGTMNISNSSSAYINTLFSIFSKIDYSYDNKYILGVTVRRDGSSKFGANKRYGVFPSVSAGWRVSNEKFMQEVSWISDLKLRGSYGILGSESNINPSNAYTLFGGSNGSTYYAVTGSSGTVASGFAQTTIGNPGTSWERDVVSNIGVDGTLFNNSFNFSIEYFKKTIEGLLFPLPLPAVVGGASSPTVNIGNIQNTGWDFSFNYRNRINKKVGFNVGLNITTYKNTIMNVPDPGYFDDGSQQQLDNTIRNMVGHPVSSFFGYKVIGIFKDDEDVANSPTQTEAKAGRFKYADVNGDKNITPDDRTFLGSPNPDFTYGVNLGVDYNGFDLSAFFYGSQGNKVLNALKVNSHFFSTYTGGKSRDLLNAWTPENTDTNIPVIESGNTFSTAGTMNSFFVEDGSFLKLKSLMLGYSFNKGVLSKYKFLSKMRIYVQATNLFTRTRYSGLDPELGGSSSAFGIDYGNYPNNMRSYLLGINFSL